ncbi:hypothetical protein XENTR_v10005468 [Xenopus tropicalis]|nr:hypothetical protein XENTR_v10005468 [Xenopus tropicalis]
MFLKCIKRPSIRYFHMKIWETAPADVETALISSYHHCCLQTPDKEVNIRQLDVKQQVILFSFAKCFSLGKGWDYYQLTVGIQHSLVIP